MKISYNWLKEYLPLDKSAADLAVTLTDIGLEVESLDYQEQVKGGLNGVVVGYVLTCEKHPEADRLHITTVDIGTGTPLQIVCGAPNVAQGQFVAVATVGTTLYPKKDEEFKIKKSKIRGIESLGMLCAEDELGLGQAHDGIMLLPNSEPGTPLRQLITLNEDVLIEIGLTPNRVDAASHIGVARDLAAFYQCKIKSPEIAQLPTCTNSPFEIEIEHPESCVRYAGIVIEGIQVGPSPDWLQTRLRSIGITPKNNVVDCTNFVLHELGQPLHAFDAAHIKGNKIKISTCVSGTEFITLDGEKRKLHAQDLMICNADEPICMAGVFGGLLSGVNPQTTTIFLESACFNPVWVRKTARRHGLFTDSSFRFERGTDPNACVFALQRAIKLITDCTGGKVASSLFDYYPLPVAPYKVTIRYDYIQQMIGKDLGKETIYQIIRALDMDVYTNTDEQMELGVPTYRVDVRRPCDVLEDILRIYGYNNVEIPQKVQSTLSYAQVPDRTKLTNVFADKLTANGYLEIMSNSLTKAAYYDQIDQYPASKLVSILNPLSNELNALRQTLLFGGLEAIARNISRKNAHLKLYENGNCYQIDSAKKDGTLKAYSEEAYLALFITGKHTAGSWNEKAENSNFYTLKSSVEQVLRQLGADIYKFDMESLSSNLFDEGFTLKNRGEEILNIGSISATIRKQFDIQQPVFYAEIRWTALMQLAKQNKVIFKELPKFPDVRRDLALLVNKDVQFADLRKLALRTEKNILKQVSIFDIYEGDKIPSDKKQYALSFILQDKDKTLTDVEIDKSIQNLVKSFEREFGASLR